MPGFPVRLYGVCTAHGCLAGVREGLIRLDPVCDPVAKLCTWKGCLFLIHTRALSELAVAPSRDRTTFFGNRHQLQSYFLFKSFPSDGSENDFPAGQQGCLMISSKSFALSVCSLCSSQV